MQRFIGILGPAFQAPLQQIWEREVSVNLLDVILTLVVELLLGTSLLLCVLVAFNSKLVLCCKSTKSLHFLDKIGVKEPCLSSCGG